MFLFVLVMFGSTLPMWLALGAAVLWEKFKGEAQNLRYKFFIIEYIEYLFYYTITVVIIGWIVKPIAN